MLNCDYKNLFMFTRKFSRFNSVNISEKEFEKKRFRRLVRLRIFAQNVQLFTAGNGGTDTMTRCVGRPRFPLANGMRYENCSFLTAAFKTKSCRGCVMNFWWFLLFLSFFYFALHLTACVSTRRAETKQQKEWKKKRNRRRRKKKYKKP